VQTCALPIYQDTAIEAAITGEATIQVRALEPGVPFSVTASAWSNSAASSPVITASVVQANVVEVAEVVAKGSLTITGGSSSPGVNRVVSVAVGSVQLLGNPVNWLVSHEATASRVAVEINDRTHVSGYSAVASGPIVTISAALGTGASQNGRTVS